MSPSDLKYFSTSSSVTCYSVGGSHLGLLSLSTSTKILEYNISKLYIQFYNCKIEHVRISFVWFAFIIQLLYNTDTSIQKQQFSYCLLYAWYVTKVVGTL